jgi:hypothetical protein
MQTVRLLKQAATKPGESETRIAHGREVNGACWKKKTGTSRVHFRSVEDEGEKENANEVENNTCKYFICAAGCGGG